MKMMHNIMKTYSNPIKPRITYRLKKGTKKSITYWSSPLKLSLIAHQHISWASRLTYYTKHQSAPSANLRDGPSVFQWVGKSTHCSAPKNTVIENLAHVAVISVSAPPSSSPCCNYWNPSGAKQSPCGRMTRRPGRYSGATLSLSAPQRLPTTPSSTSKSSICGRTKLATLQIIFLHT